MFACYRASNVKNNMIYNGFVLFRDKYGRMFKEQIRVNC